VQRRCKAKTLQEQEKARTFAPGKLPKVSNQKQFKTLKL
jgi:hypothetical protein